MEKKILIYIFLLFTVLLLIPPAQAPDLCSYRGYANKSGTLVNTTDVISVTGAARPFNATILSTGFYTLDVEATSRTNITIQICGVSIAQGQQNFSCGADTLNSLNISISSLANGASCSYSCACSGSYCCSGGTEYRSGGGTGTCQASACSVAATTTTTAPPAGGGGGAATTVPTVTTTIPPAEKPPEVKPVDVPVTEEKQKEEVLTGVTATDLGLTDVKPADVEIKQTGELKTETKAEAPKVLAAIDTVLLTVTEEKAKTVLNEIKQAVSIVQSQPVVVSASVQVFEVKAKETGKTSVVSKISLSFTADKQLKNLNIVEVIPKSIAASILDVIFTGEKPTILQADPIVQWSFDSVKQGESKNLSYIVKKNITVLETKTIAAAQSICVENWSCIDWSACVNGEQTRTCTDLNKCGTVANKPEEKRSCLLPVVPSNAIIVIVIIVIIVIVAAFVFWKKGKFSRRSKPRKTH